MNNKIYKFTVKKISWGCLVVGLLTCSKNYATPSYNVIHSPEGPTITGLNFHGSDIQNATYLNLEMSTGKKAHITLYLDDNGKKHEMAFGCYVSGRTTISGYDYKRTSDEIVRRKYENELEQIINSCDEWIIQTSQYPGIITRWDLRVEDGWRGTSKRSMWLFTNLTPDEQPQPATCSASVVDDIKFGVIGLGQSHVTQHGTIAVECSSKTGLSIKINGGRDLENTDGSLLSFDKVDDIVLYPGVSFPITITGTITRGPRQPGSYRWYAPVTVTYN